MEQLESIFREQDMFCLRCRNMGAKDLVVGVARSNKLIGDGGV